MRRALVSVAVVLAASLPHATDAGKKKVEAFVLHGGGSHATRAGVELSLDATDQRWTLRASDGTDTSEVSLTRDEPWAELAAFDRLYQAVPSGGGVKVTVKKLPSGTLDDDALRTLVIAEADKRRIHYGGVGLGKQGGVARIVLGGDAGSWPVVAHVGMVSGTILAFEVDPYAAITPALPAKAASGSLSDTVGGVTASLVLDSGKELADGSGGVADYTLTLRKGKKSKVVHTGWVDEPLFEVVALTKLIWVRGGDLIVAPAKKLAKRAISAEKAIAIVEAEAKRRGIPYDGAGASSGGSGVLYVDLAQGETNVVSAVVGARSKLFLRFDVSATGVTHEAAPTPREPEPITSSSGMQTILDEHNRYRAAHCAPALTWSDDLAATAQQWAEHLRDASCAFEHSGGDLGENLAAGSTGYLPPEEVVGMWYREISDYDFQHGGFGMDTGHFTQVVWKSTKRVGCGMVTDCDGMDIWVCNYDPAGNWEGQFAKNVLPTTCK